MSCQWRGRTQGEVHPTPRPGPSPHAPDGSHPEPVHGATSALGPHDPLARPLHGHRDCCIVACAHAVPGVHDPSRETPAPSTPAAMGVSGVVSTWPPGLQPQSMTGPKVLSFLPVSLFSLRAVPPSSSYPACTSDVTAFLQPPQLPHPASDPHAQPRTPTPSLTGCLSLHLGHALLTRPLGPQEQPLWVLPSWEGWTPRMRVPRPLEGQPGHLSPKSTTAPLETTPRAAKERPVHLLTLSSPPLAAPTGCPHQPRPPDVQLPPGSPFCRLQEPPMNRACPWRTDTGILWQHPTPRTGASSTSARARTGKNVSGFAKGL